MRYMNFFIDILGKKISASMVFLLFFFAASKVYRCGCVCAAEQSNSAERSYRKVGNC